MNISSNDKTEFYPTPEFRNILSTLTTIKQEVTKFGKTNPENISYNRLIKQVDALEEHIKNHYQQLNNIDQLLTSAASAKLTHKQRTILRWLTTNYTQQTVYTALIQQLSNELGIPKSTVRWNLKGLREAELIKAGTKENKGIPVTLTNMGRLMANYAITASD